MNSLIALLGLMVSLCHADVSHLQPSNYVNYRGFAAMAQGPSNSQGFQSNQGETGDGTGNSKGTYSVVDSNGIMRSGHYTLDGKGYHPFPMNYQYGLRQPEDSEEVRREKEQFARIANRNSALHEYIADSNFRAQVQAYDRAYAPYYNYNHYNRYNDYNQPQGTQDTYEVAKAKDRHHYLYEKIAAQHAAIGAQRAAGNYDQ